MSMQRELGVSNESGVPLGYTVKNAAGEWLGRKKVGGSAQVHQWFPSWRDRRLFRSIHEMIAVLTAMPAFAQAVDSKAWRVVPVRVKKVRQGRKALERDEGYAVFDRLARTWLSVVVETGPYGRTVLKQAWLPHPFDRRVFATKTRAKEVASLESTSAMDAVARRVVRSLPFGRVR